MTSLRKPGSGTLQSVSRVYGFGSTDVCFRAARALKSGCTVFGEAHAATVVAMIPVSVVVCVMGGWCSVYLMDTLLRVKIHGRIPYCFLL